MANNGSQFWLTFPKGMYRKATVEEDGQFSKISRGWKIWLRNGPDQDSLSFLICIMGIIAPAS